MKNVNMLYMFYHVFLKIIHNELLTKSDTWPIILLQYYLFKMLNWSTTKEYCNIMQKEEKEILEMGGGERRAGQIEWGLCFIPLL